jgi:hypothetical protein
MAVESFVELPVHITISVQGADQNQIAKGIAAAMAVFDRAGVTPERAADARFAIEGWDDGGFTGPISDDDLTLCGLWEEAEEAALSACCEGWERKPRSASLELADPRRRPPDFSYELYKAEAPPEGGALRKRP